MANLRMRGWDGTVERGIASEQAARKAVTVYLRRWMEEGDWLHCAEQANATGERVLVFQVCDLYGEPTDAMAVVFTGAEA